MRYDAKNENESDQFTVQASALKMTSGVIFWADWCG